MFGYLVWAENLIISRDDLFHSITLNIFDDGLIAGKRAGHK